MNHKTIITELRRINAWRRGDETVGQPAPGHFGDVLDAAAILIDQTDARCIEREERIEQMAAAWDKTKAELARVTAENERLSDCINKSESVTERGNLVGEIHALHARNEELLGIVMRCLGFWEAPNPTFGCGAKRQAELSKIKSAALAAIARNEGIAHE